MESNLPLISQLIKAVVVEDYASAIDIITSDKFNPNEVNKSWGAPVLSALINIIGTSDKYKDKEILKTIFEEIVNHKDFDPNVVDAEGDTIMMYIARHPSFNWLVPFIMNTGKVDITVKNFMHRDAIEIAERSKLKFAMQRNLFFSGNCLNKLIVVILNYYIGSIFILPFFYKIYQMHRFRMHVCTPVQFIL